MDWDLLGRWLRDNLLPGLLIVVGALLVLRAAGWIERRRLADLDAQIAASADQYDVATDRRKRRRAIVEAVGWSVRAVVVIAAASFALTVLGVPLATLVAPATIAGVAIGFGAQQVVGDLLAGFFLLAENQFSYGDVIRFSSPGEQAGVTGTVEEMTLRITRLRTIDGELVTIPNGSLIQVTNLSKEWSRAVVDVPISTDEDLGRVTPIVQSAAEELASDPGWEHLLLGTPTVTGVESVETRFVRLRVIVRTQPGRQFEVARELRLRITNALKAAGIATLAADLHAYQVPLT